MDLKTKALEDAQKGLRYATLQKTLLEENLFDAAQDWCQAESEEPLSAPLQEFLSRVLTAQKQHMGEDAVPLWIVPRGRLSQAILNKRPILRKTLQEAEEASSTQNLLWNSFKRARS